MLMRQTKLYLNKHEEVFIMKKFEEPAVEVIKFSLEETMAVDESGDLWENAGEEDEF